MAFRLGSLTGGNRDIKNTLSDNKVLGQLSLPDDSQQFNGTGLIQGNSDSLAPGYI